MNDKVFEAIAISPLFLRLNKNIKALYEREGRIASDEEYKAIRAMIIGKVMINDKNVADVLAKSLYTELREA
jgi:hypothetical protein